MLKDTLSIAKMLMNLNHLANSFVHDHSKNLSTIPQAPH